MIWVFDNWKHSYILYNSSDSYLQLDQSGVRMIATEQDSEHSILELVR